MAEFIWSIFFDFALQGPGAFLVWAGTGFKGKFLDVYTEQRHLPAIVGLCFWILLVAVISYFARA